MGSGVVILENSARSHCLQCGEDNVLYDLVPIPDASQIALYEMQRGPAMQMDPSPHHHRPSSMTVMLASTSIHQPPSWTLPHAFSGNVVGQREAGFICEQYPAPLLPCPALLTSAPCSTSLTMDWGQRQADKSYP